MASNFSLDPSELAEHQAVAMSPGIRAGRWGQVANRLIEYRDYLRLLAGAESPYLDAPEHRECYADAARSLGPHIYRAVTEQKRLQAEDDCARPKMGPPAELTQQQFEALGRDIYPRCAAHEIDGRPLTNVEMSAVLCEGNARKQAAIDRDGCCGGEPMADGVCFGYGMCPRGLEIQRCEKFCQGYLQWLDVVDGEAALAGDTARPETSLLGEP